MEDTKKYYKWLCNYINNRQDKVLLYETLLQNLFSTEFYWLNSSDHNRAMDGLYLRKVFMSDFPEYADSAEIVGWLEGSCSVLELMVSLALKIEREYLGNFKKGDQTWKWFWEMVENLDLDSLTNKNFKDEIFEDRMQRFLAKTENPKKKEGVLRLFGFRKRDTKVNDWPIWDQMMAWINEKV